jgi:cobalt-zinc-cadmium efflux system protein
MKMADKKHLKNPFVIPFIVILIFGVIEFFGGIWTQSLALLGDAWHMFSDAMALGLAMIAAYHAAREKAVNHHSRAELMVSIFNAVLMIAMIVWIVIEAVARLNHPREVAGGYVMMIAFIGLVINVIVAKQLHQHEGEKGINHQAALLHVMGDLLGSVAALAAGLVIYLTGWLLIDPILSLLISVLLIIATLSLIKNIWLSITGDETREQHVHHH